jgi:hypothetical protein
MIHATNRTLKTSHVFRSIRSLCFSVFLSIITFFVFGCAKSNAGGTDGESHFLLSCDATCEGGLICICGVCTMTCEDDKGCKKLSSDATCVDPHASKTCESSDVRLSTFCDVACSIPDDCLPLGLDYECRAGFCRIGDKSTLIDAGSKTDAQESTDGFVDEDAGSAWEVIESNTSEMVSEIWGVADDDIWALSQHALLHYNGRSWEVAVENEQWNLVGLWGSAPDDIWAVGRTAGDSLALIVHYDGISWQKYDFGETRPVDGFTGIWGTSANNIYAFQQSGSSWQMPWHWDGSSWKEHDVDVVYRDDADTWGDYFGEKAVASGTSPDNIIVADNGGLFRYDGQQWIVEKSELSAPCYPTAAWALSNGDYLVGKTHCGIYRYHNDSATNDLDVSEQSVWFEDFWGFSDTDIFAVGSYIWHYDGQSWSKEGLDYDATPLLSAIWGSPSGVVWVVGDKGTILRLRPHT